MCSLCFGGVLESEIFFGFEDLCTFSGSEVLSSVCFGAEGLGVEAVFGVDETGLGTGFDFGAGDGFSVPIRGWLGPEPPEDFSLFFGAEPEGGESEV